MANYPEGLMHLGIGKIAYLIHVMQDQAYSRGIKIRVCCSSCFNQVLFLVAATNPRTPFLALVTKHTIDASYNFHCQTIAQKDKVK